MDKTSLYLKSLNLNSYQLLHNSVFIKDEQGRYLWANDFFVHQSAGHKSISEIVNKNDYDFSWQIYADELRINDQLLLEHRQSISVYEKIVRYDGQQVDILTRKCPLFDQHQTLIGLIGFCIELPKPRKLNLLSPREQICLHYLSQGLTYKQIAKELNLSPRTVETYINSAKSKLGIETKAQLIGEYFRAKSP
ncbi:MULTISPECIES: PAS and helix-turn-helix domain-containing protein [Legionella]|uniref:LuxR family transcriptional regulator n=1 Tax=Legionella drozanskii LLAP-1 TaxID=1212489 RepID=A0A0W0SS77_9GAMM|nr:MULTISPECIES: PAS and helix-turn-helix domain-containing protein [Legionella]KTC86092.1 LuxR family transcriptional regulator [Legionella drozanskii LLAP-1]